MLQIHCLVFNPFYENTYLIATEAGEAIIIDPGCLELEEENRLKAFIETHQLRITKIINTHCHLDHVFGNQFVKDTYKVKMYCHANEQVILEHNHLTAQMYGIKRFAPTQADGFITEGETIQVGEDTLEVLYLPGHAPGHIGLLNRKEKWLISGDVLFRESIGRTDFPFCNHQDLIDSINQKLFVLPDEVTVYAGHGQPTTIGHEKRNNPFLR